MIHVYRQLLVNVYFNFRRLQTFKIRLSERNVLFSVKPSQPIIHGSGTIHENYSGTFTCTTYGCRPSASIYWRLDGFNITSPQESTTYNGTSETYTVSSNYTTDMLQRGDNLKTVECIVKHEYFPADSDLKTTLTLNILCKIFFHFTLGVVSNGSLLGLTKVLLHLLTGISYNAHNGKCFRLRAVANSF